MLCLNLIPNRYKGSGLRNGSPLWTHLIIIASDSHRKDHKVGIFTPSCVSSAIPVFSVQLCPSLSLSRSLFPSDSISSSTSCGHHQSVRVLCLCSTATAGFQDDLSAAPSVFAYLLFHLNLWCESCNSAVPT